MSSEARQEQCLALERLSRLECTRPVALERNRTTNRRRRWCDAAHPGRDVGFHLEHADPHCRRTTLSEQRTVLVDVQMARSKLGERIPPGRRTRTVGRVD